MKTGILLVLCLLGYFVMAQVPIAKVDINMEGRSESEVNEEGYTPWYIARGVSSSITVSNVTFELRATSPKDHTTMRCSWSKALVQSPYYMKLVNDGVKIDNDSLLAYPNQGGALELHITGLPVGKHNIQTYHNLWEDTTKVNRCPINVYLNNQLVHSKIFRSMKVEQVSDATLLLTQLDVVAENQEMVLRIEPVMDYVGNPDKETDFNVVLNGFELNTSDITKLSSEPIPASGDMHVDADQGFFNLQWQAALDGLTQSHTLYFGTDSVAVSNATSETADICKGVLPASTLQFRVNNLYNLNTYYWRVDETNSEGMTTKGKIWSFRPRHLAFPGAEGYGRFAIGGRGGKVIYVTNLDDDGPGSFRDAVENHEGSRTILFNVSGIITLNSRLVINDDYVTVAGQTAPGKGVCFRWAPIGVIGDDLIVQNLRVRLGIGITYDGMGLTGADHSIIDHCSISWTIDEAFSSRGAHNITLQRTLISEALNEAGHSNYPPGKRHGFAASIGGDIGSFHHNLLAHCAGRNWSLAGGLDGNGYYSGRLDITNNVVYNWDGRTTDGGAHEVNFVNNYYKKGAACDNNYMLTAQLEGTGKGSQSYYYAGNVLAEKNGALTCDGSNNECARNYQQASSQVLDWELWVNEPFFPSYVSEESAEDAFKTVLSDVGCTQPVFDNHDIRMVDETLNGTFSIRGSKTNFPGLPDNEQDLGGWEAYPGFTRTANWDSDKDGLPDWWENIIKTNPNSASNNFDDANADADKNGYTNLEEFLHWMSKPHYFIAQNENLTIDLKNYTRGFTNNPVYSVSNVVNGNANLVANSSVVSFSSANQGIAEFMFDVTDADGSSLTQTIGIYIGTVPDDDAFSYDYYKTRDLSEKVTVGIGTTVDQLMNNGFDFKIETYPNPANKTLNVKFELPQANCTEFSILDISGRILFTEEKQIAGGIHAKVIDINEFLPGVYFLKLSSGNLRKTVKFIKK